MTPSLDANETIARLEAAVAEARAFFGIDPLYDTPIIANIPRESSRADINIYHQPYLTCAIRVDLAFYQSHPERIRVDMAHEVAHILSAEILRLRARMPEEWRDDNDARGQMFSDAVEMLTVRLEKLFVRERPESAAPQEDRP